MYMLNKFIAANEQLLIFPPVLEEDPLLQETVHFWLQIRTERISIHEAYMLTAIYISRYSHCIARNVGAVIVQHDKIHAAGVNGSPDTSCKEGQLCIKDAHREDLWSQVVQQIDDQELLELSRALFIPTIGLEGKRACISHCAERTAISSFLKKTSHRAGNTIRPLAPRPLQGSAIYSTLFPCHLCAQEIIDQGISDVFYYDDYQTSLVSMHNTAELMKKMSAICHVEQVRFTDTAQRLMERYGMDLEGPSKKKNARWIEQIG